MLLIHFFIPYISRSSFVYYIDIGQGDSTILHINNKTRQEYGQKIIAGFQKFKILIKMNNKLINNIA